jgi:Zn-dependent protease with chaperone function
MIIALALLLGSAVVGRLAPLLLRRLTDPVVALVGWLTSVVAVVVTSTTAMVVLLLPDHGLAVVDSLHHCWHSVQHGTTPPVEAMSGAVGIALLTGVLTRLAVVGIRNGRLRARARQQQLAVLRVAGRRETGRHPTMWLDHDSPLAFSLAGRPGVVVATEGLRRHLTSAQVDAVLTHERAHLDGRHHQLVAVAEVVAATLPFLPLFTRAATAVRELVEMAADAAAVRSCGVDTVRTALLRVSRHGAPGIALAMSRDALETRLDRLQPRRGVPSTARRRLSCGIAGVTAVVMPAVTGSAALLAVMLFACHSA